jgi:hypothetical protein
MLSYLNVKIKSAYVDCRSFLYLGLMFCVLLCGECPRSMPQLSGVFVGNTTITRARGVRGAVSTPAINTASAARENTRRETLTHLKKRLIKGPNPNKQFD